MLALFFEGLSPWHLLVVFALALLFWGNRLPEVARSLGRAVNEFKKGLRDVTDEIGREDTTDKDQSAKQLHAPNGSTQIPAPKEQIAPKPAVHETERAELEDTPHAP